jgi:hypothetical protein
MMIFEVFFRLVERRFAGHTCISRPKIAFQPGENKAQKAALINSGIVSCSTFFYGAFYLFSSPAAMSFSV